MVRTPYQARCAAGGEGLPRFVLVQTQADVEVGCLKRLSARGAPGQRYRDVFDGPYWHRQRFRHHGCQLHHQVHGLRQALQRAIARHDLTCQQELGQARRSRTVAHA